MKDKTLKSNLLIKKYRLLNQVRQEDMAKKIGVSRATLINYEKGHTNISLDMLDKLKSEYPDFNKFIIENSNNGKPIINNNGIIDFKIILNIIFRDNKKFIFKWVIAFGFLGAIGSLFLTNYYSAGISLFPAENISSSGNQLQSLAMTAGINLPQKDQSYNITDVAKSRRIAEKVLFHKWKNIDTKNQSLIEFWNLDKKGIFSIFLNIDKNSEKLRNLALKKYFNLLNVQEDRRTGLIQVNIEMESPNLAAEIANFIGTEIQTYIQKQNTTKATKEKLFIKDRLTVVKAELEQLEDNLKEFKKRNRSYDVSPELFMIFSQKLRETETKQQVYVTLQQQIELARINEVRQTPIINILDDAKPAVNKSRPNRVLILFLFILGGFFIGSSILIIKY
jgi:uncharacterized protein involved in exopolysaccharide biosynthesis/DNA-binding XRE family transcriptional regulator